MNVAAVVAAGGSGERLPGFVEKPYIMLGEKPILAHTIERLHRSPLINSIIVAVSSRSMDICTDIVSKFSFTKVTSVTPGGDTRTKSVYNALTKVPEDVDLVLIHDGVRPFIDEEIIAKSINVAWETGAAICAVPVVPTIKKVKRDKETIVTETLQRSDLMMIQTPQVFKRELLLSAYKKVMNGSSDADATDDSSLVEQYGHPVRIVTGSYNNIKITTPEDLIIARAVFEYMNHK